MRASLGLQLTCLALSRCHCRQGVARARVIVVTFYFGIPEGSKPFPSVPPASPPVFARSTFLVCVPSLPSLLFSAWCSRLSLFYFFLVGTQMRQQHPENKQSDNIKKIGELWRAMSEEEKEKWKVEDGDDGAGQAGGGDNGGGGRGGDAKTHRSKEATAGGKMKRKKDKKGGEKLTNGGDGAGLGLPRHVLAPVFAQVCARVRTRASLLVLIRLCSRGSKG